MAGSIQRQHTAPRKVKKTKRNHPLVTLTSLPAGKQVPVAFIPILREDSARGRVAIKFDMMETSELLMNPIRVYGEAWLVPHLADPRFGGSLEQLNRAAAGLPQVDGGDVVPFVQTVAFDSGPVWKYPGLHAKATDQVNAFYPVAYNLVQNYKRKNRSPDLPLRTNLLDTTLAEAFWPNNRLSVVVPHFDDAMLDGEVMLTLPEPGTPSARLPVRGLGLKMDNQGAEGAPVSVGDSTQNMVTQSGRYVQGAASAPSAGNTWLHIDQMANGYPDIYTELSQSSVKLTLANLEVAVKAMKMAKIRQQYGELADQYAIDMLMNGIEIPEQDLKAPILIGRGETIFGMSKRYATDAGNLDESAVTGETVLSLPLNTPKLNPGGVIVVIVQAVPEALWERQRDPYMFTRAYEEFPQTLKDDMDPQKVQAVTCGEVDTDHAMPNALFGWAPLHWDWAVSGSVRLGGKFWKPKFVTPYSENRERVWSTEVENPVLGEDTYLVNDLNVLPFQVPGLEPFEAQLQGAVTITGLTQFGNVLIEDREDHYDAIVDQVDFTRVENALGED